jgi:hypothetical protein
MERFQWNDIEWQRNADAVAAMQRMTQMWQSASPYKISSEVRGLIDQVEEKGEFAKLELCGMGGPSSDPLPVHD